MSANAGGACQWISNRSALQLFSHRTASTVRPLKGMNAVGHSGERQASTYTRTDSLSASTCPLFDVVRPSFFCCRLQGILSRSHVLFRTRRETSLGAGELPRTINDQSVRRLFGHATFSFLLRPALGSSSTGARNLCRSGHVPLLWPLILR